GCGGGAAHVPGVRPLPAHGDARHGAARSEDQAGREARHVVRVLEPRRDPLRGAGALRRHAQRRPPGVRRRRQALLPRHGARAAGAEDPVRGVAAPLPRHAARGRAGVRRIAVHQPAEDAPRHARPLAVAARGMAARPELRTERLLLRRWRPRDLAPLAELNADLAGMAPFPAPLTAEQSAEQMRNIEAGFERHGYDFWAVGLAGG